MKKMNKKGFLLAEAIVVGVFVLSLFTFLFVNVVPLVGQYEATEKYDTINGAYNANLIRTMILEDANSEEILNLGSNPYKIYEREDLCSDTTMEKNNYCWKLLGDTYLNVDKIYITWYRTAKIKATSLKNDVDFDRAARDYIASLDDYDQPAGTTYDNYKRIIVCYNDGTFANIEVKLGSDCIIDGTCPPATTEEVSCIITAKGTKGNNNWYTSDVNIHLTTKGSVLEYGLSTEQEVVYNYKQNDELLVDSTGTTYYGYVKDSEGFTATCSITVKRDTTVPTGPNITNPTNGNPTSQPFSLTVTSSDPESGIDYWYYSYDEENWTKYDNPEYDSYEKETFVTSKFSQERDEDVYIKVCNKAGLCSVERTPINLDLTAPECSLEHSGESQVNGWYTSDVTFTLNVEASIKNYLISEQDISKDSITSYDNLLTKKLTSDTAGTRYYAYVKDSAGNIGKCESELVKRDTTPPPKPTIINQYDNIWVNISYPITVSSTDNTSGNAYWAYKYAATSWKDYSDEGDANSYGKTTFTTTDFKLERDEDVYIRVCDVAGNCSEYNTTRIKIDKTDPVCEITTNISPTSSGWFIADVKLTMTPTDELGTYNSGVKEYNLSTNSSPSYDGITESTRTSETKSQMYYCYVKDNAGNTNSDQYEVKLDKTYPYLNNSSKFDGFRSFYVTNDSGSNGNSYIASYDCSNSGCVIYACAQSGYTNYHYVFNSIYNSGIFADSISGFKTVDYSSTFSPSKRIYYVSDNAGNTRKFSLDWKVATITSDGSCSYGTGTGGN